MLLSIKLTNTNIFGKNRMWNTMLNVLFYGYRLIRSKYYTENPINIRIRKKKKCMFHQFIKCNWSIFDQRLRKFRILINCIMHINT